ncbi:hypothetical protein F5B21DRAFT_54079 [Xylaria acuta]|nr:hypothetical protein F5B21DRAFT_54079 [Xylaria acuta]
MRLFPTLLLCKRGSGARRGTNAAVGSQSTIQSQLQGSKGRGTRNRRRPSQSGSPTTSVADGYYSLGPTYLPTDLPTDLPLAPARPLARSRTPIWPRSPFFSVLCSSANLLSSPFSSAAPKSGRLALWYLPREALISTRWCMFLHLTPCLTSTCFPVPPLFLVASISPEIHVPHPSSSPASMSQSPAIQVRFSAILTERRHGVLR